MLFYINNKCRVFLAVFIELLVNNSFAVANVFAHRFMSVRMIGCVVLFLS